MTKKENTAYSELAREFNLLCDAPLKKYTSFKVGGPADLLALPKSKLELINLLKLAGKNNIPVTIFGGGTNLLISDKGIRGLTVITRRMTSDIRIIDTDQNKKTMAAEAGERLAQVCRLAVTHGLSGLEFAAGIPGTIGGAIKMNAGTPSENMAGIVDTLDVLDTNNLEIKTIARKDLDFSYRSLNLAGIILAARLSLKKADPQKVETVFNRNLAKKKAAQPVSAASAGCFFKNPGQGMTAGELIEKSGLKGAGINDAMVSKIHANYIINLNAATCTDILRLKQHIKEIVFKKYHINLETEVRIEGE